MDLSIFSMPFLQRAIIGGVMVSILLSFFGVITLLRKSSFFGDAIAHSSLAGVAIGLYAGISPIFASIIYASGVSFFIPYLNKVSRTSIDALLGIILPVSMSLGVVLISLNPGYQPDLISFLFGNILSIGIRDIYLIVSLTILTLVSFLILYKKIINISFDPDYAKLLGIKVSIIDTIYHLLLSISIVLGVSIIGIILVNALLIIPSAIAKIYAKSLKHLFFITPIISVSITLTGIFLSIVLSVPTGPTIALVGGLIFIVSAIMRR